MYSNILLVWLLSLSVLTFYLSSAFAQSCSREGDKRVTSIENLSNVIQICLSNNETLEWKFICFSEGLGDITTNAFCLGMVHIGSTGDESYGSSNNNLKLFLTNCDGNKSLSICNFSTTCKYVNESDYCYICHNSLEHKCELVSTSQQSSNAIGIAVGSVLSAILVMISLFSIMLILFKCMRFKNTHHGAPNNIRSVSRSSNRYGALANDNHMDRRTPLMAEDSFDSNLSGNQSYEILGSRIGSAGKVGDIDPKPQLTMPPAPPSPSSSSVTVFANPGRKYESQIQPKCPTSTKTKSNILDSPKEEDFYASIVDGYIDTQYYTSISRRGMSKNHDYTSSGKIYVEPPRYIKSLRHDPTIELDKAKLKMGDIIAQGQFGIVYSAQYSSPQGTINVAVKKLKDYTNKEAENAFIKEAMILNQFQHPNALMLIGVVSSSPYMMITELLKSELRELLLKLKKSQLDKCQLFPPLLLQFCINITAGMKYLAEMQFIHRDLAARNVLVSKDLICRIADFGMTRQFGMEGDYTSKGGQIPLRWCAPEAVFYQKYSEKSDVWSLGMTMYEIWSLGMRPWPYSTNEEIVRALSVGTKLPPPTGCNRDVYKTMIETWRIEKSERPTFSKVLSILFEIELPASVPQTDPVLIIGNDPKLSVNLYKSLQTKEDY